MLQDVLRKSLAAEILRWSCGEYSVASGRLRPRSGAIARCCILAGAQNTRHFCPSGGDLLPAAYPAAVDRADIARNPHRHPTGGGHARPSARFAPSGLRPKATPLMGPPIAPHCHEERLLNSCRSARVVKLICNTANKIRQIHPIGLRRIAPRHAMRHDGTSQSQTNLHRGR